MQTLKPRYCFCQYDIRELLPIALEKFVEGRSTMELLQAAKSKEEKDKIVIVSLLDVDDRTVTRLLSNKVKTEDCHILSCRNMMKNMLKKMLSRPLAFE